MKKHLWNYFSKSAQLRIELARRDVNQVKADPDKQSGNNEPLKHLAQQPPRIALGIG